MHGDLLCHQCHDQPQQDLAQAGHGPAWWLGSPCRHSLTAPSLDVSPMDAVSAGAQKDELTLRIVVRMPPQHIIKGVSVGCRGSLTCPSATTLGQGAENASLGLDAVLQLCTPLPWLLGPQAAGVFPGLDQGEREGGLEDAG